MKERYDELQEVKKSPHEARTLEEVLKFNPYHDALGRFASANGAISMTIRTNSKAGQKAIANIKAKQKAGGGGGDDHMSVQDKITDLFSGGALSSDNSKAPDPNMSNDEADALMDDLIAQGIIQAPPGYKPKAPAKQDAQANDVGNTKKQMKHKIVDSSDSWRYLDEDKRDAKVAKSLGVSKEEAHEMADSIISYSGFNYDGIRAASRGDSSDPTYKHQADQCEKFIKDSPKWAGGQLYRGIKVYDLDTFGNIMAKAAIGKPIDMRGVSSWSSDQDVADGFSGGSHPVIFVTNGKSTSKGTSIKHLSKYPDEDEVLMSKDAVFTPTRVEQGPYGTTFVYGDMA